jgi:LPXTG-motif cell wall-anchored protein
MKKENTILIVAGLAAIGAGYYFYMKSKKPVRKGYTITVPEPTKITASQYYAQTQAPQGQSLLSSVLSIFKKKPTVAQTTATQLSNVFKSGALLGIQNKEISNFF